MPRKQLAHTLQIFQLLRSVLVMCARVCFKVVNFLCVLCFIL